MAKFRITLTEHDEYRPMGEYSDTWLGTTSWVRISNEDFTTIEEAKDFIERYKRKGKVVWEGE